MKTVTVNPTFLDTLHALAVAEPFAAYAAAVVLTMAAIKVLTTW